MTYIFSYEYKEFDEAKCLAECSRKFIEIRNKYDLDEDRLNWARQNPLCLRQAMPVLEGCTEQGLKDMMKKIPDWERSKKKSAMLCMGIASLGHWSVLDPTADMISDMSDYYEEKCRILWSKLEQLKHFEVMLNLKEQQVSNGDVAAMFFLGKAYEEGRFCVKDVQKSLSYYQKAKDKWAGDLSRRYEEWLDKAVQDSGLEVIRRMGREYVAGTFAEEGAKNRDCKLKKEIKWLNKAIEAGDGWAAFTKANICYYGYGRWKKRKQEAYNNYIKAAQSKDSIYALEYGEMCLKNGNTHTEVLLRVVDVLKR